MTAAYTTRKPTGRIPWPILLIAGVEKAGKTYACAAASASELVGRTLWITVGEDQPDEYGAIDGADFEIVEHDGTYRSILGAVQWATAQPRVDGKPTLIVLDSAGRVWNLLSEQAQATANERARRNQRNVGPDGATISMDLWNIAKQRWNHILDALRDHDGPVILTARLERVSVVDDRGEPTKEKDWKVQAEKNLPFEVGAMVQMRAFGDTYLTGVRSLRFRPRPNEITPLPDFTVDQLWRNLGLGDEAPGPREHANTVPRTDAAERTLLLQQIKANAEAAQVPLDHLEQEWEQTHGEPIGMTVNLAALAGLRDRLAEHPSPTLDSNPEATR